MSFSEDFSSTGEPHWQIIKELLTGMFGVPNHHPKSQPFFDHVFTFSLVDGKVWFRNYQILEESGSLAEIGPRMVLNPVKIFDGSFCGQTLWENATYVTPTAKRSLLRRAKAGKYQVIITKSLTLVNDFDIYIVGEACQQSSLRSFEANRADLQGG